VYFAIIDEVLTLIIFQNMKIKEMAIAIGQVVGIALSIFFISFVVFAWVGPTSNPPEGNISFSMDSVEGDFAVGGELIVDGNVGIGTTDPQAKLDVDGPIYVGGNPLIGGEVISWTENVNTSGGNWIAVDMSPLGTGSYLCEALGLGHQESHMVFFVAWRETTASSQTGQSSTPFSWHSNNYNSYGPSSMRIRSVSGTAPSILEFYFPISGDSTTVTYKCIKIF
jgi:hypothetical protein